MIKVLSSTSFWHSRVIDGELIPILSNGSVSDGGNAQNSVFRIVTGCTWSTLMVHLHAEIKLLFLKDSLYPGDTQIYSAAIARNYTKDYISH